MKFLQGRKASRLHNFAVRCRPHILFFYSLLSAGGLSQIALAPAPDKAFVVNSELKNDSAIPSIRWDFTRFTDRTDVGPEHGLTEEEIGQVSARAKILLPQTLTQLQGRTILSMNEGVRHLEQMEQLAIQCRELELQDILVIGGQQTGAQLLFTALVEEKRNLLPAYDRAQFPRIHFITPETWKDFYEAYSLTTFGVLYIEEPQDPGWNRNLWNTVVSEMERLIGKAKLGGRLIFVGHESTLPQLEHHDEVQNKFLLPESLSLEDGIFSPAGLLPLALAGKTQEMGDLLEGAGEFEAELGRWDKNVAHPALFHAAMLIYMTQHKEKKTAIVMPYSEKLRGLGDWVADQWSGVLIGSPLVVQGAVGTKSQHASLQAWDKAERRFTLTMVEVERFDHDIRCGMIETEPLLSGTPLAEVMHASLEGVSEALTKGKRPNGIFRIDSLEGKTLGRLLSFFLLEREGLRALNVLREERGVSVTRELTRSEEKAHLARGPEGIAIDFSGVLAVYGDDFLEQLFDEAAEIQIRVGLERLDNQHDFLNLPEKMLKEIEKEGFQNLVSRFQKLDDVLVTAIGGSSVGTKMLLEAIPTGEKGPNIHFLENVDPDYTAEILHRLNPKKTGIGVVSKSGKTLEPAALSSISIGLEVVAITDEKTGLLRREAIKKGWPTLSIPPLVDGRFSALSHVSLFFLALKEFPIRELLEGAKEYVAATELSGSEDSLNLLKGLRAARKAKDRNKEEGLRAQLKELSRRRLSENPGYILGVLGSYLNLEQKRNLVAYLCFSGRLKKANQDWLIQLVNESLERPGMDWYALSAGIANLSAVLEQWQKSDRAVFDLISVGEKSYQSKLEETCELLLGTRQPFIQTRLDALGPRQIGAYLLMRQQATMVQSKSLRLKKEISYTGQPGVEGAKRATRRVLERQKGIERGGGGIIPEQIRPVAEAVIDNIAVYIAKEIRYSTFDNPSGREYEMRRAIEDALHRSRDVWAQINQIWFRGEEAPKVLNARGNYSLAVVPLDVSENIEINNGSVGSIVGIYQGDEFRPEKLIATFTFIYGPNLTLIAMVEVGGERLVYDFVYSHEEARFVQQERGGQESSLIEMGYAGTELAVYGKQRDWPPLLREFMKDELNRKGKKVRISESLADLYEMLLKGGFIAAPLTRVEAALWGATMVAAGGQAMVLTENGPEDASQISLNRGGF